MADEDITLDGKPLQSLRVADLKAALEQRNLPKSGQKNTLIKRLKGALMLENLQRSSSSHSGLQPNSQIGEEMCQNSFIKQYLAQQQELLRHRLAREARQEEEADESPTGPEEDEDHSEDNDSPPFVSKHQGTLTQPSGPDVGGENSVVGYRPASTSHHRESNEAPRLRTQRASAQQGHKEPAATSPPRAVASFSVRVLGQPDSQGYPATAPPGQEKEAATLSSPKTAQPVLNLSRSARSSAENHVQNDSDEDDDDDDDSDDDEDWGPSSGAARRRKAAVPSKQVVAPSVSSAAARSKRKLQPPQHIPPPQVHDTPMQLRHPTPPPSPPPNLFPLPDTPKQSPPDDQERDAARDAGMASYPPPTMQRQDSDSSSGSSSPEPPMKRKSGPLSLLMHKMESEEATSSPGFSGEAALSTATCSSESPLQSSETKMQQEVREMEEEKQLKEEKEREKQKLEKERIKIHEQEREKKRLEEEREKERKRLEEERKQRQEEEQEEEKRHQEEEKEKKRKEEERRREEQQLKEEEEKKREKVKNDRKAAAEEKDLGSSSDSDSKSESSSRSSSSSSSSSSRDKIQPASQLKKADQEQEAEVHKKTKFSKDTEKPNLSKREVSEPSTAAVTEAEPDSESSMAQQPASGAEPESSESRMEESTTPKAFAARKISLSSSKASPASTDGGAGEPETGSAAGRKRRWGSSTAVTVKKPSISITTDSLKSLIPDIKVNQEAVVDLHPEELQMSGDEENSDTGRSDPDKGLKIRRTVTQVVPSESQENGQTNMEEDMEKTEGEKQHKTSKDKKKSSLPDETSETQISVNLDGEPKPVTPSDSLVRRSISQQKSGVSVTIDDPVRTTRQPSPPRGKVSNIIHVINLVRPFTLLQLKELLNRTGSVVEEGFWIDKIKSHCYVTYATTEEAVATRTALHGVKWPPSNPKVLGVDFCEQDELDYHKGIRKPEKEPDHAAPAAPPQPRLPPLMPVRDRDKDQDRDRDRERDRERDRDRDRGVRDLLAERQREMERRERARGEREWDRDKVREFARPGEEGRRSRSRERERRRRERAKSKEKKTDKKEKGDEPPAKLLDDLFLKTKAAPCIYWLPLTEEQANQRLLDRVERQKERERRRKEQEEEDKKRDEEKKERLKGREKDGGVAVSAAASGRGADGDRERERARDREGDKRRDSNHRSRRPSPVSGGGRRSRSRSNPRDRRR